MPPNSNLEDVESDTQTLLFGKPMSFCRAPTVRVKMMYIDHEVVRDA